MPVLVAHPLIRGTGGIEQPQQLLLVDLGRLIRPALSPVPAEARAEDVTATPRLELNPAVQALSDS
jgi:hypothetical protein